MPLSTLGRWNALPRPDDAAAKDENRGVVKRGRRRSVGETVEEGERARGRSPFGLELKRGGGRGKRRKIFIVDRAGAIF